MGAIKKLMNPFRDRFFADRALRELMIMASANHPNIISYYTGYFGSTTPSGEHDVYICMELMYTTLSQASRRHMNHLHFSSIVYQIHCGLIHLHDHHIYHRDLKPANIAINQNFQLKLIDFGLSKQYSSLNMTPYIVTRYYRAPEVIIGIGYDQKVDNWSVGCILAELLLGFILMKGKNPIDQWRAIVHLVGVPSEKFMSNLVPEMREAVQKAWGNYHTEGTFNEVFTLEVLRREKNTDEDAKNCKDLIYHLLRIDRDERYDDEQVIGHPYVKRWMKDSDLEERELNLELDMNNEATLNTSETRKVFFYVLDEAKCENYDEEL